MSAYFRVNATFSHVTVTAICFVRRAPTFDVRFDATSNLDDLMLASNI